ncbi:MAG: hypothetical protein M3Z09_18030 [Acidobacteriota bacterium]|nr:hypothetical protein [Acidobacteriota bacterium]
MWTRRLFAGVFPLLLRGDEKPPTLELLTSLAAHLSAGNQPGALETFAKKMPGYQDLAANIGALTAQYDILCVIEIRDESGDGLQRMAETEWFLELHSKEENGPTERRQQVVRISTEKLDGKWRITGFIPRSILDPPKVA